MVITTGKKANPLKVIIYGPEGVGKSTIAAAFPSPLFIDVENGTGHLDVARTPKPTSWPMLKSIIAELTKDAQNFKTLVLDSIDWTERLCIDDVCAEKQIDSLGGAQDFGKSYNLLGDKWSKFLDSLGELQNKQGLNIVFVGHSGVKKFELPNEAGAYDRYELKMEKKTSAISKEWADAVLFCNYYTLVVEVEGKKKAQGGKRVIYSNFHPCWDAKNRHMLKDELDMSIKSLAPMFAAIPAAKTEPKAEPKAEPKPEPKKEAAVEKAVAAATVEPVVDTATKSVDGGRPDGIPDALWDLMVMGGVTDLQIRQAVAARGYYPVDTPIKNYDPKFITGTLIAAFDKVKEIIAIRERDLKNG